MTDSAFDIETLRSLAAMGRGELERFALAQVKARARANNDATDAREELRGIRRKALTIHSGMQRKVAAIKAVNRELTKRNEAQSATIQSLFDELKRRPRTTVTFGPVRDDAPSVVVPTKGVSIELAMADVSPELMNLVYGQAPKATIQVPGNPTNGCAPEPLPLKDPVDPNPANQLIRLAERNANQSKWLREAMVAAGLEPDGNIANLVPAIQRLHKATETLVAVRMAVIDRG